MANEQLYPVFLRLDGARVVLVGGGTVAAGKLAGLLDTGAKVTVIAPEIRQEIRSEKVTLMKRAFEPADLDGADYVVAAAPPAVNLVVSEAARQRHLFVNAVDDVASASAYLGGVVRRDGVVVAISTGGAAPALAGLLREAIEEMLPENLADWVATARALRAHWKADKVPMGRRRPELLAALNRLYSDRSKATGGHA
jgi:uroporphyrin-III C-methyltransferase/precorrin-2 dehydrogenase/sirohydrochlorin ferrochelatase